LAWIYLGSELEMQSSGNMMRIAIAGSGGLAQIFAQYLNDTVHPFIILSREVSSGECIPAEEETLTRGPGPACINRARIPGRCCRL
jgi:hypothetical protein